MDLVLTHDPDADAVYIKISDMPYAFGEDIDHERRVDYAESGEPIGIEILCVSAGVNLQNLPFPDQVGRLMEEHRFRVYA